MENELQMSLRRTLDVNYPKLQELEEKVVSVKDHADNWSKKEILGHLIDSASNNHQRFVRAQFNDDLVFDGYAQNDWVKVQDYQNRDWQELVELWLSYNRHLAKIIAKIPNSVLKMKRKKHNLNQIAFNTIPQHEQVTLQYFINDYIIHLDHHLQQILY